VYLHPLRNVFLAPATLYLLGLSALAFFFFQTTLSLSFFWDDYELILRNQSLKDWKNIFCVFHDQSIMSFQDQGFETQVYRPLRTLYFIILVSIFGKTPQIFFGLNLFFHCLNTLLFKKTLDFFSPHKACFLKYALIFIFLFHPIHLENINTAAGIADLLGTFFFLLAFLMGSKNSLLCTGHYTGRQLIGMGGLCYLAMLCKEIFITAPLIILIGISHKSRLSFKPVLFLGMVSLIYLFQRQWVTGALAQKSLDFSIPAHILYVFQTIGAYGVQFFFPVHLSQIYLAPDQEPWMFGIVPLLLGSFLSLGVIAWKQKQGWSVWFLAFFIALFPISNVIPINTFINDRLFYFPSLILLWFLFEIFRKEIKPVFRIALVGVGIFLLSACFYLGFQRNREWQDPAHIWKESYQNSSSPLALWNMVCFLFEKERYQELTQFFKTNTITLPENFIPFYYRTLCVASLKIGLEEDGWFYYQTLIHAEKNTPFFSAKDWKEFLTFLETVHGNVKDQIYKELMQRKRQEKG